MLHLPAPGWTCPLLSRAWAGDRVAAACWITPLTVHTLTYTHTLVHVHVPHAHTHTLIYHLSKVPQMYLLTVDWVLYVHLKPRSSSFVRMPNYTASNINVIHCRSLSNQPGVCTKRSFINGFCWEPSKLKYSPKSSSEKPKWIGVMHCRLTVDPLLLWIITHHH